ncbi:nitric oxide-associated protein 1 [Anguilla rostrata]|uniref:nitric oxide-associated protein 1 n=1 Tax=Anguilla rostrata TaxID=7938 RepID=UPI0030D5BDBD
MQRLLHVSLRQFATVSCSRCMSVSPVHLRCGIKEDESFKLLISNFTAFKRKTRAPTASLSARISVFRSYNTERNAEVTTRELRKESTSGRYASVEPETEEQFVFLDYTKPDDSVENLVLNQNLIEPDNVTRTKEEIQTKTSDPRVLESQLKSLKDAMAAEVDPHSCIEFHDTGFPEIRPRTRNKKPKKGQKVYGSPDPDVPVSDSCCTGCGAVMHCTVPDLPGYLPSEKYRQLTEENRLHNAICQRCHLLTHHQKALNVQMSKEEYRHIVSRIRKEKALVLLILDLLDIPDSIIPDLLGLIGENKHIVVLGNKVDLLPGDSDNYLKRIKGQILQYCTDMGILVDNNIKGIHLISAKTGYGIENLISSLQSSWKYKGDVYLVGTTNAGKSTLFNTLLESDYCKSKASEVIRKATISPWPGTTLNLLKFPIINPTPYRIFKRSERLKSDSAQTEADLNRQELRTLQQLSRQGYLVGRVGRTFRTNAPLQRDHGEVEFDSESLSIGEEDEEGGRGLSEAPVPVEFTHNELKYAHWLYDTPGIMKDQDVLSLLTEKELKMVVPTHAIVPRTFVLKPGTVMFLGALARIDYLEGEKSCWFSVIASNLLPIHITSLDKADVIYQKHAGNTLLGVPTGGEERMREFPPLVPQDLELKGQGLPQATADIKLSSAGWVAVTGHHGDRLLLRAHVPEGVGIRVRDPPLLPYVVNLKGERLGKSAAYKTKKPQGLLDRSLSEKGAERLKVKKKKK